MKLFKCAWQKSMADIHTPEQRSYNMSRVRSKDTKPELIVRKYLFSQGYRYRIHDKKLPGSPDLVLPKYRIIIFVHGCFFHGHEGCPRFTIPKTKTEWWLDKINSNKRRDTNNFIKLTQMGWRVLIIYECALKPKTKVQTLQDLVNTLKKSLC